MRKTLLTFCGLLAASFGFTQVVLDAHDKRDYYMNTITVEELKEHLYYLAADEFEGRETSKPGQKKAAAFLESYYNQQGLISGSLNGVQQQSFPLRKRKLNSTTVTLLNGKKFSADKDLFCIDAEGLEGKTTFSKIVFVGYGIDAGSTYNDYANLDVKDALVVVRDGEPLDKTGMRSLLSINGDELTDWSYDPAMKMNVAQTHGAKAIAIVREDYKSFLPRIKFWLEGERMELVEDDNQLQATGIPQLFISRETADIWLEGMPKKKKRKNTKTINEGGYIEIEVTDEIVTSENVLAFIEGSDEKLKNEIVIISAHYDHIGIVNGEINNGADDDGSGTVSAMEIGEAFIQAKKDGNGAKRSVLILHVSGEEKGLFGSDYYTRHPVYSLSNTVCDFNIDMIGRVDESHEKDSNYIYLIGSDRLSMDLHNLSEAVNKQTKNIKLDYTFNAEDDPNQFYYRSDHYNFAKNNIPVIFYFSGVHEDYHKPGDDAEKILYGKMTNVAQLIFSTAWEVANSPQRVRLSVR